MRNCQLSLYKLENIRKMCLDKFMHRSFSIELNTCARIRKGRTFFIISEKITFSFLMIFLKVFRTRSIF